MYFRPRIIPCLLINSQHDLVKTVRFKNPRYLGDPINAVKIFNEKGVDELCILDITATVENRPPMLDYIKNIATEAFMPLSYGGGVTSLEQIEQIFHLGYEKVILNTALYKMPELVKKASQTAGAQSIVASIDVQLDLFGRYFCYICDGKENTKKSPIYMAKMAEQLGAGELFLNSINRDGSMKGYDLNLIKQVADSVSIPVIACGGAGSISDLKSVFKEGRAHAAAAGSLFVYYGPEKAVLINVPDEEHLLQEGIYKY